MSLHWTRLAESSGHRETREKQGEQMRVGIDVSQDSLDVAIVETGDKPVHQAQFSNDAAGHKRLHHYLKKRVEQGAAVCLEATGSYGEAVIEYLYEQGYAVSVVNPARIKAYAASQLRRNKTDKLDAALIADFCRTQNPPRWTPPSPAWRELRALVRHLDDLENDRQRQHNRLHALRHSTHQAATVQAHLQQQIDLLQQQIEQVKATIQQQIDHHPDLKREHELLISIKGIGDLTAAKLLAEFRAITEFEDVRQLVAYAGLNPRQRQSGTSVRGASRISKTGRASIRAALYMPAISAQRHNPILRAYAERLAQAGVCKMAIVVAVMRKLLHLVYGILKSGQPFDPHYLEKIAVSA
jgi:transposase